MRSTKQRNGGCARINLCEWDIRITTAAAMKPIESPWERLQNAKRRSESSILSGLLAASRGHPVHYLHNGSYTRGGRSVKAERAKGDTPKGCVWGKRAQSAEVNRRETERRISHVPWTVIPSAANKSNRSINPPHIFVNISVAALSILRGVWERDRAHRRLR